MHNGGINGGSSVSITRGIIYQETSNNYCRLAHILHQAACNIVWSSTCLHCTCRRFAIFVSRPSSNGNNGRAPSLSPFRPCIFTIIIFSRNNGTGKWKKIANRLVDDEHGHTVSRSKICAEIFRDVDGRVYGYQASSIGSTEHCRRAKKILRVPYLDWLSRRLYN